MIASHLRALALFISFFVVIPAKTLADGSRYADKSALSEGHWVKISISETGFYKLTYADLRKMGFPNPEKVSVHGYGGLPMEENFAIATYLDDVPSVPVWRGPDYLLFYGKGTVKWTYNDQRQLFTHENNAYATLGYYFVTDATETNEMTSITSEGNGTEVIDTYDDYILHEKDQTSITVVGRPFSGRDLFGESFDAISSRDFPFFIPGITNDDGIISYRFVAKVISEDAGIVSLRINNDETLSDHTIPQNTSSYSAALDIKPEIAWEGAKTENTTVNISFSVSRQVSNLDYIRLQMKRQLQPYGPYTFFRSISSVDKASRFRITNASSNLLVFDVSEGTPVRRIETEQTGTDASFSIPAGGMREFAMVDLSQNIPTPVTVGTIEHQNLHGLEQTDMVIVSPKSFISDAERLAKAHRRNNNLTVHVVTPDQIYNEFSSGGQEATAIRRFMKMFYDRQTSENDAPKYLLLFGDGRHDNRKLTNTWMNSNDNYVVTYQSHDAISQDSYVSDDYFGFLLDTEGADPLSALMQLGIGRLPISTNAQARNAVDKIISYMENAKSGAWKNKLCFIADDGNARDSNPLTHAEEANSLAEYIENTNPAFVSKKIYFDAYKRSMAGGKPTYPDVRAMIQKELKEGTLIINYTGHGDAESWAEEKVMTKSDINSFTYTNLPLWITASCDFAPFDAIGTSAGEDVILHAKSGGIALYTTARVAYSNSNLIINTLFQNNLFEKTNGVHQTLGEVMKNAKNQYKSRFNNTWDYQTMNQRIMSFLLLGDPALRLAYPDDYNMVITEINGQTVTEEPVNFSALQKITIKGQVKTADNDIVDQFNGLLSVTIFDSQQQISTLNNANYGTYTYSDYPNIIYTGNASVQNGEFSFTFTVPKDISYMYQNGKISLYAADNLNGLEANGSYKNFTVGGTSDFTEEDLVGPEIRALYLNTLPFNNGDKVNETPMFVAIVWDENGINVGGNGVGHDITLTIDNNPAMTYVLNNYYSNYLEGNENESIIKFPIPALESGKHTGQFKIWDTHNNSTSHTFNFTVIDNYKPSIIQLTAGPNPAKESVDFYITHDLPETLITVQIQVFDMMGKMIWTHEERGSSEMFNAYRVKWYLTDGSGTRVRPGIYVYRATVSSNKYQEASKANKLIIVTQ